METFSTYEFYRDVYHGKLGEDDYNATVFKAYTEIVSQTNGKAKTADASMQDKLKLCECELVDVLHSLGQSPVGAGAVSSINNDGYSIGFATNGGANVEARVFHGICERYLQYPVNLMCRWL